MVNSSLLCSFFFFFCFYCFHLWFLAFVLVFEFLFLFPPHDQLSSFWVVFMCVWCWQSFFKAPVSYRLTFEDEETRKTIEPLGGKKGAPPLLLFKGTDAVKAKLVISPTTKTTKHRNAHNQTLQFNVVHVLAACWTCSKQNGSTPRTHRRACRTNWWTHHTTSTIDQSQWCVLKRFCKSDSQPIKTKTKTQTTDLLYDRSSSYEFTSLVKELEPASTFNNSQTYELDFTTLEKQFESYNGINIRLRCAVRVQPSCSFLLLLLNERWTWWWWRWINLWCLCFDSQLHDPCVHEETVCPKHHQGFRLLGAQLIKWTWDQQQHQDGGGDRRLPSHRVWVQQVQVSTSLFCFAVLSFNVRNMWKTRWTLRYHLKDVVIGKVFFLLVRIKIKHMEVAIIRRESTGSGNQIKQPTTQPNNEPMEGPMNETNHQGPTCSRRVKR